MPTAHSHSHSVNNHLAQIEPLRKTGIEIIGDVPWGTHFCMFYNSKDDLLDILIPYFRSGLENGEFCMWITSKPLTKAAARSIMRKAMPEFEDYMKKGQIEILAHDEWYLQDGVFDSDRVLNGWVEKLDQATGMGFNGLRLTGNTFWLEKEIWQDFMVYEEAVNRVIGNYRMLALCTYSMDRCGAAEVLDVAHSHQFVLANRYNKWTMIENAEIQQTKEALSRRTAELENLNEELESLTYTISHDLRSPLRAIDGFANMIIKDAGDNLDQELFRKLNVIRKNTEKMTHLIDDLLNLSRMGRAALSVSRIDLNTLVKDVWQELRAGNPDRSMDLKLYDLPPASVDGVLMRQVISNLLDNAAKFTKYRKRAVIEVSGSAADSYNTFCVKDNGAGFDMVHYDKLFEVFRRLHSEKEFEGTGVGLAIVKKIIQKHGGRIWAEGKPNEGAAFYFTIPLNMDQ